MIALFILTISFFTLGSTLCSLEAAFRDPGFSSRPSGLGGAFTAVADDSNASLWNPAGIGQMETREVAVTYGRPTLGLDLKSGNNDSTTLQTGNISAVIPSRNLGAFGVTWTYFNVSKLYREEMFLVNYANCLNKKFFPNSKIRLYAGVNAKILKRSLSVDAETIAREKDGSGNFLPSSPFSQSSSKSDFAMDIGFLAKVAGHLSLGLAVKNVYSPNSGFKTEERVPREYRTGVAFFLKDIGSFEDMTPTFDLSYRKADQQKVDIRLHLGIESWFGLHTYGIRMGGNNREGAFGLSYIKTFSRFMLQIDYAFLNSLSTPSGHFGSHRVSITLKKFVSYPLP